MKTNHIFYIQTQMGTKHHDPWNNTYEFFEYCAALPKTDEFVRFDF
uniref:Uncharacterized protein n=1 Tax=Arundo donax TaxID=35708 RepID=A0A0A9HBR5_ARUDO